MTKSKTKIMSLVFAFMLCFGTLFASVANRTVTANAESKTVTQVRGNVYEDSEHNKYFKQKVFQSVDNVSNALGEGTTAIFSPYTFTNGENLLTVAQSENKERYFAYEPIVWQVLSVDANGIALVVSDKVLASIPFQPTYTDTYYTTANGGDGTSTLANDYTYSNVRYWLNSVEQTGQTGENPNADFVTVLNLPTDMGYPIFLQTAFSSSEQSKIKATSGIGASDATTYAPAESGDKVFLLSKADIENTTYFANNSARIKKTTDLAKATYTLGGEYMDSTNGGAWWLRSPSSSVNDCANYVNFDGATESSNSIFVSFFLIGVVPAMYLDTSDMPELKAYSDSACTAEVSTGKLTADNGTNHNYIQFGSWPQTVADVTESAEGGSSGSGSSGSGAGSGSGVSPTGVDINLIGLYFGMGAVAVSAMAINSVLNKNKKKLEK